MSTAQLPALRDQQFAWDLDMIRTLKETVCKGATDAQFKMFAEVCKATGLNPFLKEIWYVPGVGVMAGRDGYLRVANEHPAFDGMETRVERDDKNVPIRAICSVWRKDRGHPITCEAYYSEYRKSSPVWQTYPSAMISKVAEVLALKRSFTINGLVTEEEIGSGDGGPQETPAQVAQRQIEANNQRRIEQGKPPITEANPPIPTSIGNPGTDPPDYEQRHAALVNEANEILNQPPTPKPERKRGTISFKAVGEISTLKTEIRKLTGTDDVYYGVLSEYKVHHCDELDAAPAKKVWVRLAQIRKNLIDAAEIKQALALHRQTLGDKQFMAILGSNGCETEDDVINLAGAPLQALLADFMRAAEAVAQ